PTRRASDLVGRFVRSRTRGETASIFLPTVPILMGHAAEMEAERDHVLDRRPKAGDEETGLDESLIEQANRPEQASDQIGRASCRERRWSTGGGGMLMRRETTGGGLRVTRPSTYGT